MDITLRSATVIPMLELLGGLNSGQARREQLEALFDHPDYDFEFRRYQIPGKGPVIDYFMKLPTIREADIPLLHPARERMLRWKHPRWLAALENPGRFRELLAAITGSLTGEALAGILARVRRGLPRGADLSGMAVIATMSIGTSFGYVFEDAFHIDLMGLEEAGVHILPDLLAHEMHHIAFMRYTADYWDSLTAAERYVLYFAGEGLAVKFCNNARGALSRPIDPGCPENQALDSVSMDYLNARFPQALAVFRDTLAQVEAGTMSEGEIQGQMETYWLNFRTETQGQDEPPLLKQSLLYSFGNDLFGAVYDAYGPEALFDCLRHPLQAVRLLDTLV